MKDNTALKWLCFSLIVISLVLFEFTLQAIWSIVKKKNRAPDYSNVDSFPKFGSFVRAVIGLPYVPLDRMEEATNILDKLSKYNTGTRERFCQDMIKYLKDTWLEGSIPRKVWNTYNQQLRWRIQL